MAPSVLLVDDEYLIRYTLPLILSQHGYAVTSAANVPEDLERIRETSYDLLLSDLHMPGPGDGLTVVLATRGACPQAVTLLLSADPEMSSASPAAMREIDQILMKPMDVGALLSVMNRRLANSGSAPPVH